MRRTSRGPMPPGGPPAGCETNPPPPGVEVAGEDADSVP